MKNGIEYRKDKTKRIVKHNNMYYVQVLIGRTWYDHFNGPYAYLRNARTEMAGLI